MLLSLNSALRYLAQKCVAVLPSPHLVPNHDTYPSGDFDMVSVISIAGRSP